MTEERENFLFLFYRKTACTGNLENLGGDWTLLSCTKKWERYKKSSVWQTRRFPLYRSGVNTCEFRVFFLSDPSYLLHFLSSSCWSFPVCLAQERKEAFFLEKIGAFICFPRENSVAFVLSRALLGGAGGLRVWNIFSLPDRNPFHSAEKRFAFTQTKIWETLCCLQKKFLAYLSQSYLSNTQQPLSTPELSSFGNICPFGHLYFRGNRCASVQRILSYFNNVGYPGWIDWPTRGREKRVRY